MKAEEQRLDKLDKLKSPTLFDKFEKFVKFLSSKIAQNTKYRIYFNLKDSQIIFFLPLLIMMRITLENFILFNNLFFF